MREAIYNSTMAYVQLYGARAGSSDETRIGKLELCKSWRSGAMALPSSSQRGGLLFQDLWRMTLQQRL